jgi:hypothetical protein
MKDVPAGKLASYLGVRSVRHVATQQPLALTDEALS